MGFFNRGGRDPEPNLSLSTTELFEQLYDAIAPTSSAAISDEYRQAWFDIGIAEFERRATPESFAAIVKLVAMSNGAYADGTAVTRAVALHTSGHANRREYTLAADNLIKAHVADYGWVSPTETVVEFANSSPAVLDQTMDVMRSVTPTEAKALQEAPDLASFLHELGRLDRLVSGRLNIPS